MQAKLVRQIKPSLASMGIFLPESEGITINKNQGTPA